MTEEIKLCPVCGNTSFSIAIQGKDYFLSGEDFDVIQCAVCDLRMTWPIPAPGDIGKYYESQDYISHDTNEKKLLNLIYKIARIFTIRSKFRLVRKYAPGHRIMDIGCGTGEFLNFCKNKGYECLGVEPNAKAREFAMQKFGLDLREEITFGKEEMGTIDCISMWHVLEHIKELNGTLQQIKRALKPSGILILALPNPDSWDAKFYAEHWAAYDLPRHLYHFTQNNIEKLSNKNGFKLIRTIPQYLDAFYISMLSEKYRNGKKDPLRGLINGARSNFKARHPDFGYSSNIYILSADFS